RGRPTGAWPPTTSGPGSNGTGSGWPWATSAACPSATPTPTGARRPPTPSTTPRRLRRPGGEEGAEAPADAYQAALAALPATPRGAPRLELVWLGVGEDGHCLSLFPGRPELEVTDRLVVPVHDSPKPPPDRVS